MLARVDHGAMVGMVKNNTECISFAAATDAVRRCTAPVSGYNQKKMASILKEIRKEREDWLKDGDVEIYEAHLEVLEKGTRTVDPAILELSRFGEVRTFNTYAKYFNGYRCVETDVQREVDGVVGEMLSYRQRFPLIIDTEGAHFVLPHGGNTALIMIFDEPKKLVLFWRVNQTRNLAPVTAALSDLSRRRGLMAFGKESVLNGTGIRCTNFQEEVRESFGMKQPPALKKVAKDLASIRLTKSETLSDWTVPRLRDDQLQYAFMDCYSVKEAWWGFMEMNRQGEFARYCGMVGLSVEGEKERMREARRRMEEEDIKIEKMKELKKELEKKKKDREEMEERHNNDLRRRRREMEKIRRAHQEEEWKEDREVKNVDDLIEELEYQLSEVMDELDNV